MSARINGYRTTPTKHALVRKRPQAYKKLEKLHKDNYYLIT